MTITTEATRVAYTGDGATKPFAVPFKFLVKTDLVVVLRTILTGVETAQTLYTNYTVLGAGDANGTVTFVVAPPSTQEVVIYNDPPLTQLVDYLAGDPFPAETNETALDRLTIQQKRTREIATRSLFLTDTSTDGSGEYDANSNSIINATKVTGLAEPTGSTDASNKNYVDATVSNTIGPIPDGDTYVTATGSTTSRQISDRWGEVKNVKDFGATGDGVTDDYAAIQASLDAAVASPVAGGVTVEFPPGTYMVSDYPRVTFNRDARIQGYGATITASTSLYYLFRAHPGTGTDLTIEGLSINGAGLANYCLSSIATTAALANLTLRDMTVYGSSSADATGNIGVLAQGGWKHVALDSCVIRDHTRPTSAGDANTSTAGALIGGDQPTSPASCSVQNCTFENVTNGEIGHVSTNQGANGLLIFGGDGSLDSGTTATVVGNSFINCQGRSIKVQNSGTAVTGNTFYRNIPGKYDGPIEVQLQYGTGVVSNNVFRYDLGDGGENPWSDAGVTGEYMGSVISFYAPTPTGKFKSMVASGNIINNNVPVGDGGPIAAIQGMYDPTVSQVSNVSENSVTGDCQAFFVTDLVSFGSYPNSTLILNLASNTTENALAAFVKTGTGTGAGDTSINSILNLTNCVNLGGDIPVTANNAGTTAANLTTNVVGGKGLVNFSGAGFQLNKYASGLQTPLLLSEPDNGTNHAGLGIQRATISDDDYAVFPSVGGYNSGGALRLINSTAGRNRLGAFSVDTGGLVDMFNPLGDYPNTYTVTNPTTERALDVSAATTADVAQVLGTLITDMSFHSTYNAINYGHTYRTVSAIAESSGVLTVTTTSSHLLSDGDRVFINGVVGMTQVNNQIFEVVNTTATEYDLVGVDGSGFTAYTSGGKTTVDPYVDGKINVFYDTAGYQIVVSNRMGSAQGISLFTFTS